MYYTTQALMLSSSPLGERGRKMVFLTETHGLLTAQGQGVASARSKLGGSLTPYRLLSVTFTRRAVERVIGVEVKETFFHLWQDVRRQGYAAWAMNVIQRCMKPGVVEQELFCGTREYLRLLNDRNMNETMLPLLRLAFGVRFIHLLGYHGSGMQTARFKEMADEVVRVSSLPDAAGLLRKSPKQIHERVEKILSEISGDTHAQPARFLMAFSAQTV